jgi:hypothetical protein
MKAGFLNLFSRSLYRGGLSRLRDLDPESAEYKRVHEERERFAAAAIAFCLEYDRDFLRHFWRRLCKERDNPRQATAPKVEVEPRRWADLLLTAKNVLCAIEMKIGAPLGEHQNPKSKAFSKPGGYGDFLSKQCQEHKCNGRYIILSDKAIGLHGEEQVCGLEVEQRKWADLANGLPSTPLMTDLTKLLSSFGIWEFTFKEMKTKKLSGKLDDVGNAIKILKSVLDSLEWPDSFKVTTERDAEHWELGIYLSPYRRKKPVKGLAEQLTRANKAPEGEKLAWFGYLADAGRGKRCVYVYCSKASRKHLVTRLKEADFVVDEERKRDGESGPYCAVVQGGRAKLDDIDWFKTALEAAAGKPVWHRRLHTRRTESGIRQLSRQ